MHPYHVRFSSPAGKNRDYQVSVQKCDTVYFGRSCKYAIKAA